MTLEGILITVDGRPALRFQRRYPHPIDRVFRAVSDPGEISHWFPSHVEGERTVGAELLFDDDEQRAAAREAGEPTRADGPIFRGTVVAYDPPREFSFTWGGELLRLELSPEDEGTFLVFTHVLSHQSVAARNGSGWHHCLSALDELLGSSDPAAAGGPDDESDGLGLYYEYVNRVGPALGMPAAGGALIWERATHVDPERVRAATSAPEELAAWGAANRVGEPLRWEITPVEHGTIYQLTHDGIGSDASLAASWHALLLQLDMYLAAGQLIPVEADRWVPSYEALL